MKRQLLTLGSLALVLLSGGAVAQAQTTEPSSEPTTEPSPEAPVQETTPTEVSSEELEQFATAMEQMQVIRQDYEGQMVQAVESEGLSKERFIEISQVQRDPEAQPASEISQEEQESFENAVARLVELQQEAKDKMKEAVQSQGLEVSRFNEILAAVKQDPNLQQEVQQMNPN
ncbi:MAG: DUF4168 domain-containing protein [Cyanophyceae cyanobacterium]